MIRNDVAVLRFSGGIYDDGAFDANAMRVVIDFQQVLIKISRALYSSRHGQPHGKSHLIDVKRLAVKNIGRGSTVIPIQMVEEPGNLDFMYVPEELSQATTLMYETYAAADKGEILPSTLPHDLIPRMASVVSHLRSGCSLEFSPPGANLKPISSHACESLLNWVNATYEDSTSVVGEVFEVNVKNGTCRLFDVINKLNVNVQYERTFEEQVTTALTQYRNQLLSIVGIGEFNERGRLLKLKNVSNVELKSDDAISSIQSHESITEYIDRTTREVPEEVWDELPRDLAKNHDAYIQ
ncbi:MAG: hypothetical protein OXG15_03370 [Gammaproteobacteria bacterium]|nr:hypothetical protein [Gammaproteobacteria bacterium]